nr:MAG TPA: hypothetical protein [Caudoviricetes sp.]
MNHTEVANTLETVYGWHKEDDIPITIAALQAAADERKIASGEYAPVVRCSECKSCSQGDTPYDMYCGELEGNCYTIGYCGFGERKDGDRHAE